MHSRGITARLLVAQSVALAAASAAGCVLDWAGPGDGARCGNGVIDPGEQCDLADTGGETCMTLGYDSGDLGCTGDCALDASLCVGDGYCGNGFIDTDEDCDGSNLGGQTCVGLGFDSGTLGCTGGCLFDLVGCVGDFECGNGVREPTEECDGMDLGGESCESLGYAAGTLGCGGLCVFDTSGCVEAGVCGNHVCETLLQNPETVDNCALDCPWTAVTAGTNHTCGLRLDEYVWCWGQGSLGQLGNGSWNDSDVPVRTPFLEAPWLSAGGSHTCGRIPLRPVRCWGLGASGQLGNQGTANMNLAVSVYNLNDMVLLAAGGEHSCAARTNGAVYCWGLNDLGQIGDAMLAMSSEPDTVENHTGVDHRSLSAGMSHTCVIDEVNVYCWGSNEWGQLGTGTTSGPEDCSGTSCSRTPVQGLVMGGVAVAAGGRHTCMRHDLDYVVCWGANDMGQLGGGTFDATTQPVTVTGFNDDVVGVCAGQNHACARRTDNTVWCWGANDQGQLGNGFTTNSSVPVQVTPMNNALQIACGHSHTCVVRGDGTLYCWGANDFGQLGDGTAQDRYSPVQVTDVSPD